jgi:transcriptional regulator with XRE-family HTH domain
VEIDKDKLRRARTEAALSQMALAAAARVACSTIWALESGQQSRVYSATARRLATTLRRPVSSLAPDRSPEPDQ